MKPAIYNSVKGKSHRKKKKNKSKEKHLVKNLKRKHQRKKLLSTLGTITENNSFCDDSTRISLSRKRKKKTRNKGQNNSSSLQDAVNHSISHEVEVVSPFIEKQSNYPIKSIANPTAGYDHSKRPSPTFSPDDNCHQMSSSYLESESADAPSFNDTSVGNDNSFIDDVLMDNFQIEDGDVRQILRNNVPIPLDFEPPPLHIMFNSIKPLTDDDLELLEDREIKIKKGKYLKEENRILKKNFEKYVELFQPFDKLKLLGFNRENSKERTLIIDCKNQTDFLFRLGYQLNDRPLRSIYYRARKIFHPHNYIQFTEEDDAVLLRLHSRFGNKWKKIGLIMGQFQESCSNRFKVLKENRKTGKWDFVEENHLEDSIVSVLKIDNVADLDGHLNQYPWSAIQSGVQSRNLMQCRQRWLRSLAWKEKSHRENWTEEDSVTFINHVYESNARESSEIDFETLYEKVFYKVPSVDALKQRWYRLVTEIRNFHILPFHEVVESLHEKYVCDELLTTDSE